MTATDTTAAPAPVKINTTANQPFRVRGKDVTVTIVRKPLARDRAAKIVFPNSVQYVPVDLLGLCVGKDAWMRDILVRCRQCPTVVKASALECDMCPDCYEKAGEENAALDGR